MAHSAIEWTDASWNPAAGCSLVSEGCRNCYAVALARRLEAMGQTKYAGLTRRASETGRPVWTGDIRVDPAALAIPASWKKGRRIFVNSMSDLFHDHVDEAFVGDVWRVMADTPQHQYQILTKRPERMAEVVRRLGMVLPNVWLGASVEDAAALDRIDWLRKTPAAVRFLSCEPLIGPLGSIDLSEIDLVIVGGESGPNARPMMEPWVDEIHDACRAHGAAFFFKQWGAWGADGERRSKKANGRLYRGRVWDEAPGLV